MHLTRKLLAAAACAVAGVVALSACGSSSDPLGSGSGTSSAPGTITVGSANFVESEILANVYADVLRNNGVTVTVKPNIGARDVYIAALKDGSIDLVPEYTGNLLQYFDPKATAGAPDEVYAALAKATPSGLKVLNEATAEDADSYVVTPEFSKEHNLTSLEQLAALSGPLKVGATPEFATRPYGVPGLQNIYGAKSATLVPINDGGGPSTLKALLDGQVQVADIFSTTPSIKQHNLVTLADPKHMILAQNVVPLVAAGKADAKVTEALDKLHAVLTTGDLIEMNTKSADDKESAEQIAKDWVASKNLG